MCWRTVASVELGRWTPMGCLMSWDGNDFREASQDLLAKKLSKNVRKAMAPRKEAGGGWICMKHQKYQTFAGLKRMWKRGGVTWFLRSAIRDAAKAKGHTGRWRRWRGRWGRGNFSKTRLTMLYWRDCCLYSCAPSGSNICSFPAGTFESMIFPFPRWDMDPFPEVSLSESNSWCVSGWRCWELWHGDCRFGKMKTTWAIKKNPGLFRLGYFQGEQKLLPRPIWGLLISKPWNFWIPF